MDGSQRGSMATPADPNYVRARAGLLDALEALGPLREATVLVGAQAIYEYTRDHAGDYAVSPFTFDADLTLIPELLADDPKVIDAMGNAGYSLTNQPGIYRRGDGVQVDLLVPDAVGGRSGRGADLGVHGIRAARQVRGLEGTLVSRRPMAVRALADGDDRAYEINVAEPAALLVAKVHKLLDRIDADDNRRIDSKDAFDVFRLLQAVETMTLVDEISLLAAAEVSAEVTAEAMAGFRELFGIPTGPGTILAAEHVAGIEDREVIIASSVALSEELIRRVG